MDAQLACGRHQETIAELEALTTEHPLRERFWFQRLLALYRAGRQADALRAYRELRSVLVGQLGIEPGPGLRDLESRILRQDPGLEYRPARRSESDHDTRPETRYVKSGAVHIAYQVLGDGERDIVFVPGVLSHAELAWEDPGTAEFYRRLAGLGRLILFDKRDTGLSDRAPGDSPLEERMDDVQAVMNAVSSDRAVLFGYSEGAPMSILFAATYPEKVSSLILGSAFARWYPAPDYPCGDGAKEVYASMEEIATHRWGQGATIDWFFPSRSSSLRAREMVGRFERMAISPSAFLRMIRMIREIDVRAVLPAIHVPTLVIQRLGDRINPPFYGRYLASHIAGARYFEQPGDHVLRIAGPEDREVMFAEIEDFLAVSPPPPEKARVLSTILVAEITGDLRPTRWPVTSARPVSSPASAQPGSMCCLTAAAFATAPDRPSWRRSTHPGKQFDAQWPFATTLPHVESGCAPGSAPAKLISSAAKSAGSRSYRRPDHHARATRPDTHLASRQGPLTGSGIAFAEVGAYELAEIGDRWPMYWSPAHTARCRAPRRLAHLRRPGHPPAASRCLSGPSPGLDGHLDRAGRANLHREPGHRRLRPAARHAHPHLPVGHDRPQTVILRPECGHGSLAKWNARMDMRSRV